jgi:non-specific serine/threonine protein kinase/serine/threonine-protein kinase
MTGIFKVPNPSEARGNTVTAREILDKASQQIGNNLNKDPDLQAQLMETMAQTYTGLGLYGRSQDLTEHALAIQSSMFGERNRETLAISPSRGGAKPCHYTVTDLPYLLPDRVIEDDVVLF